MTRYKITAPVARFNGELADLVFRHGEAVAETPHDLAAVTYCRRRGYSVVAVDSNGEPLPEDEQPGENTPDPDVVVQSTDDGDEPPAGDRPADYASKGDWVAYAVSRGVTENDANAATKNELIELYG